MSQGLPAPGVRLSERLVLGAAILASLVIVWFATRQPVALAGFAAGLGAFAAIAWVLTRKSPAQAEAVEAVPDWSVTVTAIDRSDSAIAVTDRAGRLVCANPLYERWFTAAFAPPRLPVASASLERLAKAARSAWRDGQGLADVVEGESGGRWKVTARRSGRGDDYLVWTFTAITPPDLVAELVPYLDGKLGRALSQAGFSLAIIDPDGKVRAVSSGFAQRATGDPGAILTGQEFTALLRQDENDRITWARDGSKGAPLSLFYVPVIDPDAVGKVDYETTPSLILIADHGVGIGGGRQRGNGCRTAS